MKKIYTLLLASLPLIGFGQFSIHLKGDTNVMADIGSDKELHFDIENTGSDSIVLRWRLVSDFAAAGTPNWDDYVCEGIFICWPASKKYNDIVVDTSEDYVMYQHVMMLQDSGTATSRMLVFDPTDSMNTVQEIRFHVMSDTTAPDPGPDGIAEIDAEKALSQNFPNPFTGLTMVNYELNGSNGMLKVHDLTGKLLSEQRLIRKSGQVSLGAGLEAGVYFYSLWENGAMVASRRMQVN